MSVVEIILCTTCKGTGVTQYNEMTDYHKREYNTHIEDCKHCNGTGRLKKITTVTFECFNKITPGIY